MVFELCAKNKNINILWQIHVSIWRYTIYVWHVSYRCFLLFFVALGLYICSIRFNLQKEFCFPKLQEKFITNIKTCKLWHVPHVLALCFEKKRKVFCLSVSFCWVIFFLLLSLLNYSTLSTMFESLNNALFMNMFGWLNKVYLAVHD